MTGGTNARFGGDIVLGGVRENNLKNVSLTIPKGKLTVFTGVSGSGKSSIVFSTIAVESQRQLNETFPWYVRNRLTRYERPHAEVMENLSTAIVVDQKPIGGNSRSTVGTMTEVHPILRVLFSRCGNPPSARRTSTPSTTRTVCARTAKGWAASRRWTWTGCSTGAGRSTRAPSPSPRSRSAPPHGSCTRNRASSTPTRHWTASPSRSANSSCTAAGSESTAAVSTASTRTSTREWSPASPAATSNAMRTP